MRLRRLVSVIAVAAVALTSSQATAGPERRLDAKNRKVVLKGHLEGASTYGPFFIVNGGPFDSICVGLGCEEHELVIVVPKRAKASLYWAVEAPATGFGIDLRLTDVDGKVIARRTGGWFAGTSLMMGTEGEVPSISSGRYTVRVSITGGVADYAALIALYLN